MAEYIDKEKLLAEFDKQSKSADEHGRNFSFCFESNGVPCTEWDAVTLIVENFQAEDVKPVVRGKWEHFGSDVFRCSECGYGIQPWNIGVNFCPNCGVEMEES